MRVLFVTMDGGGNLPPALGIAREIIRRGGSARVLGNSVQQGAVEAAAVPFEAFREGRDYDSSAPRSTLSGVRELTCLFADRGIGRDALSSIAAHPVDVIVIDCLLWGAMLELAGAGVPVVSLVHSQWQYFRANARGPVGTIARLRGSNPLAAEKVPALTLVTTRPDVEEPGGATAPADVVHTGFVWQGSPVAAAADADRPQILVSFSTTSFPGQAHALQNVLDALDGLPVEVVATTGAVDPSTLRAPRGARVERRVDHSEILPRTRLVIGHGGHATTARALSHGIPLLVMPMHPLMDQPAIGRAVGRLGAGISIAKSSSVAAVRETVERLLADEGKAGAARQLGTEARSRDGAVTAVDALDRLHAAASV